MSFMKELEEIKLDMTDVLKNTNSLRDMDATCRIETEKMFKKLSEYLLGHITKDELNNSLKAFTDVVDKVTDAEVNLGYYKGGAFTIHYRLTQILENSQYDKLRANMVIDQVEMFLKEE